MAVHNEILTIENRKNLIKVAHCQWLHSFLRECREYKSSIFTLNTCSSVETLSSSFWGPWTISKVEALFESWDFGHPSS